MMFTFEFCEIAPCRHTCILVMELAGLECTGTNKANKATINITTIRDFITISRKAVGNQDEFC